MQKQLYKSWDSIKIVSTEDNLAGDVARGKNFTVKAKIKLGAVPPENIAVQLYYGYLDSKRRMSSSAVSLMKLKENGNDGTYTYEGSVAGEKVGHCGYVVRIVPQWEGNVVYLPGLIIWQ